MRDLVAFAFGVVITALVFIFAGNLAGNRTEYAWPSTIKLETGDGFLIAESRFFVLDVGEVEYPIDGRYECFELPCVVRYNHTYLQRMEW